MDAAKTVIDMVEHDHETLQDDIKTVREVMVRPQPGADFAAWKLNVLWTMRDFQNDLQKHFDLEEERAYTEELLRVAPQKASQIDDLEEEHRKIVADLNHILDVVKDVRRPDTPVIDRLAERLEGVVQCLQRHEAEERSLIQDVYYQEYGVGD